MDCLRNGTGTAVDYIEGLLFYILRMSDFCYLHPSTAARQRMVIDFAKDEWEWTHRIKNKKTERWGEQEKRDSGAEIEERAVKTQNLNDKRRGRKTGLLDDKPESVKSKRCHKPELTLDLDEFNINKHGRVSVP